MASRRLVEISGETWHDIGIELATQVAEKSCFAYRFDRVIHGDESDILDLWRNHLAPKARTSMKIKTPLAYELCSGFDKIFSTKGDGFSVWELLTLYEVDMFLHEFYYKCRYCKTRLMKAPRYLCVSCHPGASSSDSSTSSIRAPVAPKKKKQKKIENISICSECYLSHANCEECEAPVRPTHILHETEGLGIANKAGCTGFGYGDGLKYLCGQTLEMSTDTYNYGRFDTVYKLTNTKSGHCTIVYDVGCILSPFGMNSKRIGLCVFNLYNSDYALPPYAENDHRVPMAAIQWEILLSGLSTIKEITGFLRVDPKADDVKTFTSASFILASPNDTQVIEVSANNHWVPTEDDREDNHPAAVMQNADGKKWIVRANNCLAGSGLIQSESLPPNISSRHRQSDLAQSFLATRDVNTEWAKAALSSPTIQTDYCLGTIVIEPKEQKMHVRFRVGTRISSTIKDGGKWETFSI